MLQGIHHVAIIARDYQDCKRFYTEVLGFEIIRETYRAERRSFKLDLSLNGNYLLELFSFPDHAKRATEPEAIGLRHLAFAVNDIKSFVDHLIKNKVEVQGIRVDEITGKQFCFFYDPNRQPLEVYEI